jgi:hypothetical protein
MRELRNLVCIANGKKITIPDVSKVILTMRTPERVQVQASMDMTVSNLEIIRKNIRRPLNGTA